MKKKPATSSDAAKLRRQAEAKLTKRKKQAAPPPTTEADTRRLVHELQVHQIELEMQNEELVQSRAEVEALLRQYTDLYDFAPVGYFTLARDGVIHQVNLAGARLLGVEIGKLIKRRFGVFVNTQSRTTFNAFLDNVFTRGSKETCEIALLKDGAEPLWAHIEATCSDASRGQVQVCHAVVSDITERKQAEEALRESESRYRELFESESDALFLMDDTTGNLLEANSSAAVLYGYDLDELRTKRSVDLSAEPEEIQRVTHGTPIISDQVVTIPLRFHRKKDGTVFPVEIKSHFFLRHGRPVHIAAIRDITERKQAEEELRYLGTHDALTGLYSHGFFVEEMTRLERGRVFPVSIVMADVDHLKETNDQEGHAAGDALLKRVAQALIAAFRAEDVIARIGGDEFAVLLPATDATSAKVSLQRVRQVIQEYNAAHTGTPICLSLGVSTAENPAPLSVVLKEADANMYREKRGHDAS